MTAFAIVLTTVAGEDEAEDLARALVERRLAACVQIIPIASVYRWEGDVEEAPEHLVLCKTSAADYKAIETAILERHSYDVPEIVMMPLSAGHVPYLDWIAASTSCAKRSGGTQEGAAARSQPANRPKPKLS